MIASKGSLFVGDESKNLTPAQEGAIGGAGGELTANQMYVQFQTPVDGDRHVPVVMVHGCCLCWCDHSYVQWNAVQKTGYRFESGVAAHPHLAGQRSSMAATAGEGGQILSLRRFAAIAEFSQIDTP